MIVKKKKSNEFWSLATQYYDFKYDRNKTKNKCFICVQCLEENDYNYIFGYDQNYIQHFPIPILLMDIMLQKLYKNVFWNKS